MKKVLLFLVINVPLITVFAQDGTIITYTQERDSLVKQRFIDRYENVFMTKVPTRHMLKVGLSQYYAANQLPLLNGNGLDNVFLQLGYEFKFLPSFSIALSGHLPYYGFSTNLSRISANTLLDGQIRWFPDMKRRIRSGKSANNFSGNYIAINYTFPGTETNESTIGLKVGFQRRFLNSGFMDFALSLQQQRPWFHYGVLDNWTLSSLVSFGFAFGDWKRFASIQPCDVLLCDKNISTQWKVRLPDLTFGYYLNRIRFGFGFERKFKTSPFSLNAQTDIGLNRGFDYFTGRQKEFDLPYNRILAISTELSSSVSVQPRYYFLQKRQLIRGVGGNGLSGVYTGLNTVYTFYRGRHSFPPFGKEPLIIKQNKLGLGPLLGFQQRLFRHGYVDFNTSYNFEKELISLRNAFRLGANLAVGFAF